MWYCAPKASGIIIIRACGADRPERTKSSMALSKEAESLAPGSTIGKRSVSFLASAGQSIVFSCDLSRLILPRSVLISPLWAAILNGWASFQLGNVLVLYRWWTTAIAVTTRSSDRSA